MRNILMILSALIMVMACSPTTPDRTKDRQIILDNIAAFSESYENGDYDAIVNAYTEDGMIMPNRTEILTGPDKIRDYWTPPKDAKGWVKEHRILPDTIVFKEDIAYDYGYYKGISTNGEEEQTWIGKYTIIWQEVEPDVWKMKLDMWNSVEDSRAPEWVKQASYQYE
jgi:ketosteroid isomerase-like protein